MTRIIDARTCPPIEGFLRDRTWRELDGTMQNTRARGWQPTSAMLGRSLEGYFTECDLAGVQLSGLPARVPNDLWGGQGNEPVLEAVRQYPERFFAYGAVDAFELDPSARMSELHQNGVRGIVVEPGLHPSQATIDDPRVDLVYDACQSLGLPLLLMGGGETGPDLSYSDPLKFEQVAIRFPRLQIVYVHGGWPFAQVALGVAFRRPNVWMMPDVYFPGLPGEQDYVLAMRTFLQDRFLFATNWPYCPIDQTLARYEDFQLGSDVMQKVLHDNAARLFGLNAME